MQFEVRFYVDPHGKIPVRDLLESLQKTQPVLHRLVNNSIVKLSDSRLHGPPLTRQVDATHGIYELRIGKADIARVFFFFRVGRTIVVTNGYVKKQQKLDLRELDRARRLKADWEERHP